MGAQGPHAGVIPGEGLVGRFGATLVVVADPGDGDQPFTTALLAALAADDAGPHAATGEDLVWRIAQLLVAHERPAPTFGAVVRLAAGHLLLLHGPVRALVTGPAGDLELSGSTSATWCDQIVPDPVARIAVTLTDAGPVNADPRSSLQAGLVPGSGLVLTVDAPEPTPQTPEPGPDPSSARPETGSRSTLDLAGPTPDSEDTTEVRPASTPAETMAVRVASVGVLVADDGTSTPLDRSYVFGREPQQDESVQRGEASPIVVRDPDNLVSRVQVHVSVTDAGEVTLQDRGSANGTFVAAPGAAQWERLGKAATVLPPGWSMRLGRRVYRHVTPTSG